MLYSEIIAVCSEIHTKRINTLCGQNVEILNAIFYTQFRRRKSEISVPLGRFTAPLLSKIRRRIVAWFLRVNGTKKDSSVDQVAEGISHKHKYTHFFDVKPGGTYIYSCTL
jgi:hypothetical protein